MTTVWPAEGRIESLAYRARRRQTCSICLRPMTGGTKKIRPCGHQFHRGCIRSWVRAGHASCPICRSTIERDIVDELRNLPTGGHTLTIEYGRGIDAPLPWQESSADDNGRARGSLFSVTNPEARRALSYLVLSHYFEGGYLDDDDVVHPDSTPDTVTYEYIMWAAQRTFTTEDWSRSLLGYEGELRPPFALVEQVWDDGIEYERLSIDERALVHWWEANREEVEHVFRAL